MRLTQRDASLLIEDFERRAGDKGWRSCNGGCAGCRLHDALAKPPAQRNQKFLASIEPRVARLRAAARK